MADPANEVKELHQALGYKPLNRTWAKLEILLGLFAAGLGMFLGMWAVTRSAVDPSVVVIALVLFVLGNYLAMAGSRSHLYQSNNELAAHLIAEIQSQKDKADS